MPAVYRLETELAEEQAARPHVLARSFSVPAGLPWVQQRAAELEAQHGAPLPISEVLHRLRRLNSWAPGRPGRYAAFYVRRREYNGPFERAVEVDGATVRVAFGLSGQGIRQARAAAGVGLACAAIFVMPAVGVTTALSARAAAEAKLADAETLAGRQARAAERLQSRRQLVRSLANEPGAAHTLAQALDDLQWAASGKVPDARIRAVHWERGILAVEARGDATPFGASDRPVVRSARPVRPGVWLWGVSRGAQLADAPRPTSAEFAR